MQKSTDLSTPLEYSSFSVLNLSDVPKQTVTNWDFHKAFSSLMLDQLNTQDLKALLESQQAIMQRLDQTNQKILSSSQKSAETFNAYGIKDFQSYINLLNRMKQDLDLVFKRIRILKKKLEIKYPQSYSHSLQLAKDALGAELEEDLETDDFDEETRIRSDSTQSRLSSSKSAFSTLFETARNRISSFNRDQPESDEPRPENSQP